MSFVAYRLPRQKHIMVNMRHDEPEVIESLAELNGRKGFVIAPFAASAGCPILLLNAEWKEMQPGEFCSESGRIAMQVDQPAEMRKRYGTDFRNFHAQLCENRFNKIVLARCMRISTADAANAKQMFADACQMYPRMFVALFYTSISGTWLVATPEILLSGSRGNMATMALAGTMHLSGKQLGFDVQGSGVTPQDIVWSDKNKQEQHYVEAYITECIEQFASDFAVNGPYTTRAGDLVHLRTDINFTLADVSHLGDLLNALHPTPAVCGIPKHAAQEFIIDNESSPRRYYSGFSGTIDPDGDTHLFVSLRCMQIEDNALSLYAGGGLLKESVEQNEWEETEAKMETMKKVADKQNSDLAGL